jgi:hypothetical protein
MYGDLLSHIYVSLLLHRSSKDAKEAEGRKLDDKAGEIQKMDGLTQN